MLNLDQAQHRYLHDPAWHALVDSIESVIRRLQYTPGEVRDAAMFAAMRVELTTIRRIQHGPDSGW